MNTHRILLMAVMTLLPLSTQALTLSQAPLFIASTEPRVMLLLSRDHELSKKAYTDYTDLNGDGVLDTSYTDTVDYYGYFDSNKCYSYASSRFSPSAAAGGANSHDCSGAWSGNFLNWATMTRLDVVRKVLYGGFRSTDNTGTAVGTTVLERAFLPPDVHAFAKVYAPVGGATDVAKYTPYSQAAITLCNVTDMAAGIQAGSVNTVNGTDTTPAPLIKVASGSWPTWAMTEILQCQWDEQTIEASPRPSTASHRLTGAGDLTARVAVCAPGMLEDKCKSYYTRATPPVETIKPTGLLQQYSDVDADRRVRFGLITGSYKKNTAGGVLRKNIKLLSNNLIRDVTSTTVCGDNDPKDETDVCTGQFINQGATDGGIVDSFNRIHIAGYKTPTAGAITATNVCAGGYGNAAPYACNAANLLSGTQGTCVDWGNPLSEMYYEALRYFAGKTAATAAYAVDDGAATAVIAGLGQDTWNASSDPLPATEWCALSNIIVLSTGLTSLDNATITSDIAGLNPTTLTNEVGTAEGIAGGSYLIGSNGTTTDSLCNAKTLANLSSASGICPELPHMKGGFLIAGLAKTNRSIDLRPGYATLRNTRWGDIPSTVAVDPINADWAARQPLGTYTVGLAENLPSFVVTVGSGTISLVPACRSSGSTICSMTDLRVESQTTTAGSFLVSWEDNSAGSDYDMDTISRIQYCVGPSVAGCNDGAVSNNQMRITVSAVQSATGSGMELGYTVSGSSADGTVFPVKIPGTATCNPTDGSGTANANFFSLLTTPAAYRTATNFNTATPAATYTCPGTTTRMPAGIVSATGCPANGNDSGSTSNCGCPKTKTYTQSATPAGLLKNPLWYAAKYGSPTSSWDLKNNITGAMTPDGEPDHFFDVRNPSELYDSLANVFDAAAQPDLSASSVATNSTNLQIRSHVFQARFSSADWSGQLLSFKFNPGTTVLSTTADWDASTQVNAQNPTTGRVILTKGVSDGVAFTYANLSTSAQVDLNKNFSGTTDTCGVERVAYLRGIQTHEGANGTFTCASTTVINNFRPRLSSVLGDVVNSSPWYVGEPKAGFSDVDHPGYGAFRASQLNRMPVVYIGGNDGMLHGFDASLDFTTSADGQATAHSGNEIMAYIPSAVYPNLSKLTDWKYNKNHRYFVDGSPMIGDAYLPSFASNNWRTVLVGSLGAGGKGYYALDVTNPGLVSSAGAITTAGTFSESGSAPADTLLWEFNEANDADMGYAFNMPPAHATTNQAKQIVKMANGKWAAIVGNGYNSTAGKAVLYILFISEGIDGWSAGDYVKIVAESSGANGLSTPVPFDSDGNGTIDTIYAGDLKGKLWKFEVGPNAIDATVTATAVTTTWKVSLSGAAGCTSCTPLFSATDGGSPTPVAQPIIWPPEITLHPNGGRLVFFGTGKYLESSDNSSTGTQTFYGIRDYANATVSRSNLVAQTVVSVVTTTAGNVRTTSSNAVNYPDDTTPGGTDKGWYINLPTSKERTTGQPKLDSGTIWFNTFIPSTSPCEGGGTGWLMSMNYLDGKMPTTHLYDTNNDSAINSSDTLVSGFQVGAALGGTTLITNAIVNSPGIGVSSLTSSALSTILLNLGGSGTRGRINWREIIQ